MRILFISNNLPVPANNGQALRTLSILEALARSGYEVSFISFSNGHHEEDRQRLRAICTEVDLIERCVGNMSSRASYIWRTSCLLMLRPYSIERFRSGAMKKKILELLRRRKFDLIICDQIFPIVNVPRSGIPIILNCHNVEHEIFERYARLESSFFKKVYARIESWLLRHAEMKACRRAARVLACSQIDRRKLLKLCETLPISIVPNAIDTDFYCPGGPQNELNAEPIVLFQGSMDWYPNRNAVEYFAKEIWPVIRQARPETRFVVAGRNPPAEFVNEIAKIGNIEFTGTVPDMRPYLAAATVVVVPLRMGSGTRLKILEAAAAERPIVSTTLGAEGLGFEGGREIVLADTPTEFAFATVTLLQDPKRRSAMATSARSVVVGRYSYPALSMSLDEAMTEFV